MKIRDLVSAQPALQTLTTRPMPAKLAYAFSKNFRLVNQELEDYEKARVKILSDNWKINPETNKFDIPPEDKQKAHDMVDELLDAEVNFSPMKLTLAQLESLVLSPGELMAIEWMIEE